MRTVWAIVLVLGLGVSFTMLTASGAGPAIFGQEAADHGGLGPMEQLNETGRDSHVEEGENGSIVGDVAGEDERNIVGFIVDGGQFIVQLVAAVVFIPTVLIGLGFPSYFALPAGIVVQFFAVIGVIQFATNRLWQ